MSCGLNDGIYELNPVPIPSDPFMRIVGNIGTKNSGSICFPSSFK